MKLFRSSAPDRSALEVLRSFTVDDLPTLDVAVLGALELLESASLPSTAVSYERPLVIGSGNAAAAGRLIFARQDAVFATESDFERQLARAPAIDGAVVISASGSKHAIGIGQRLEELGISSMLFTNNPEAPAASFFSPDAIRVFPKNREPYTYNTSTYLSMIIAATGEDPHAIAAGLQTGPRPVDLGSFTGFTFILPAAVADIAPMLRTKFDELFGTHLCGRFFTPEEMKHAKTVVPDEAELFIYVGTEAGRWGSAGKRLELPLPEGGGYAAALAAGYHLIGQIQQEHPPYFTDHLVRYCHAASEMFDQAINPIVE